MKKKWLVAIFITFFIVSIFSNVVLADDLGTLKSSMSGVSTLADASSSKVRYVINAVIKIIQIVGSGIALIVVSILGIKYMLASPGEKADYKKTITPIVIGCALLFAASNIAGIIADVGTSFNGG